MPGFAYTVGSLYQSIKNKQEKVVKQKQWSKTKPQNSIKQNLIVFHSKILGCLKCIGIS